MYIASYIYGDCSKMVNHLTGKRQLNLLLSIINVTMNPFLTFSLVFHIFPHYIIGKQRKQRSHPRASFYLGWHGDYLSRLYWRIPSLISVTVWIIMHIKGCVKSWGFQKSIQKTSFRLVDIYIYEVYIIHWLVFLLERGGNVGFITTCIHF